MISEDMTDDWLANESQLSTSSIISSEPIQIISTQRGKRKLLLDGYIYRLDRSNDHGVEQWRCSKKNCRGRIHLYNSPLYSSSIERENITSVSSHSHAPEPTQCEVAILVDHIRTSAQHQPHVSSKEIVNRLLRSVTDETAANLPSITAMQRSIQRRRQQQNSFHSFPIHIEPLLSSTIEIFSRSINDNSLPSLTKLGSNQILVLTCEHQQKLSDTSIWLCTASNEMKSDFLQCIFTIQIFDQGRLIPINYAFSPSNTKDFYMKLFDQLFPSQTPKYILTNCNPILIDSLTNFFRNRSVLPHIKICSIFLHNELTKSLQQDKRSIEEKEYRSLKYLLALAYIPQSDVTTAFETLQEICSATIEGVYDRFEDLCIGRLRPNRQRSRAIFPMTRWNWTDVTCDLENLFMINTNVQQWEEIFRISLSACLHRNFHKIISVIQQLYQYQTNSNIRNVETKIIVENFQFRRIIQSYSSYSFEDYLLNLIEYLPV